MIGNESVSACKIPVPVVDGGKGGLPGVPRHCPGDDDMLDPGNGLAYGEPAAQWLDERTGGGIVHASSTLQAPRRASSSTRPSDERMTEELPFHASDLESSAISPFRELGAYEALWNEEGMSFRKLAERHRRHPGAVPSDFVSRSDAYDFANRVRDMLAEARIEGFGIRVHGTGEYPLKLRDAAHPVELLYFRGWWDLVHTRCVAVVGTRRPSPEGIARTRVMVRKLVADGFTIVSGLARGVDTVAHTAAIESGGRTIGVIGTPISRVYPKENAALQERIAGEYLLISQVPVWRHSRQGPEGNRLFFPERNITMSALTEATVIVEAGETSGTRIQAQAALQQGRKLFILDNCFRNPKLTWPAKFAGKGAVRVREYEDIRRHLDDAQTLQDR